MQSLVEDNQQKVPTTDHSMSMESKYSHVPKLKFTIQGANCELPTSLSYRRNSAMQSLFQTTTSLGSVLQSARGGGTQDYIINPQTNTQLNLESTAELKAFATVDLAKINKERSNQLKLALEDNLREKENEFRDFEATYHQQKDDFEKVSKRSQFKAEELEEEISRQKQYLQGLKDQLRRVDQDYKSQEQQFQDFKNDTEAALDESQRQIEQDKTQIKQIEDELQVLSIQKRSLQMGLELQRKVKNQELDMKVIPLKDEKEKASMHMEMLNENLKMLIDVKNQNENEKMMIEEDLTVSEQTKMELVFQREELENFIEKIKEEIPDMRFIMNLPSYGQHFDNQDGIINELVEEKQKDLLLDLIRELQQYILGMSSGTTDNSVMQSDELEELEYLIQKKKIDFSQAVESIVEFSQRKMSLNLSSDTLYGKLNQVSEQIDFDQIQSSLDNIQELEQQMRILDQKIKVIYNRCQNELKPRFRALNQSEEQMNLEMEKAENTLQELNDYLMELDHEIKQIQVNFEETYKPNDTEQEQIETKLFSLQERHQELEYSLDQIKSDLQNNEIQKINCMNEISVREAEFESFYNQYSQTSVQLKEEIKRERQAQSENFGNSLIEELTKEVAQLKCDKESSSKRLKYIETKLQNAQESVQHARQVLDNHILQAQQDQLNMKIQPNTTFNQKRLSAHPSQQSNNSLQVYGPTQSSRISTIQQQAQTLQHGQVLSPSKDESFQLKSKTRNMSIQKEIISATTTDNIDYERMHSHYIDPNASNVAQSEVKNKRPLTSEQKNRVMQKDVSHTQVKKEKSTIDVVKYYYDSSSAVSLTDENTNTLNQHLNNFISRNPVPNQPSQKMIPCQSLITPRDPLTEIQNSYNSRQHQLNYDTSTQQMSAASNDSENSMTFERKNSTTGHDPSSFLQQQVVNHNSNHMLRNQRIQLRQSNQSFDGSKQKPLKNIVVPLYTHFKENIIPNTQNSSTTSQGATSSFNMRKLSQASNVTQVSGVSVLNTIATASSGYSNTYTRPPAVPQSKQQTYYPQNDQQTPRGSSQKAKRQSMNSATRHQSKESFSQPIKGVQTKMRLSMNVSNGRPTQVGVVDFTKCNQGQKEQQFFEAVKPLIEGTTFLFSKNSQLVLKQIYLDFSLLRLFMMNYNGEKEILLIENIIKPEIPQSTLEQIRTEKQQPGLQHSQPQGGKRYEFNLIVNVGGQAERMILMAMSYEELKKWIVGINSLIGNKNSLMRLSSLISNSN